MQTFTKLYHAVRTGGRGLMIAVLFIILALLGARWPG